MGDQYLTMAEIYAKYPNEWVLIDRVRKHWWSRRVLGGHVVLHAADKLEFNRLLPDTPISDHTAFWYTGPTNPEGDSYMRSLWVEE